MSVPQSSDSFFSVDHQIFYKINSGCEIEPLKVIRPAVVVVYVHRTLATFMGISSWLPRPLFSFVLLFETVPSNPFKSLVSKLRRRTLCAVLGASKDYVKSKPCGVRILLHKVFFYT
jgi:hypothetical protein